MTPRCDTYRNCTASNEHATISDFAASKEQLVHRPALFDGDHDKVKRLDESVTNLSGFEYAYPVTGQTYSRKIDIDVLAPLTSLGSTTG